MNITIAGTGAMALAMGAQLARRHNVFLIGSWAESLRAIRRRGIILDNGETQQTVLAQAPEEAASKNKSDLLLILVKSWQTEAAARRSSPFLTENAALITLQNGLSHINVLENYFGKERVLAAAATLGATLLAPGHVRSIGRGNIALSPHSKTGWATALFQESGFDVTHAADQASLLWGKAVVNAAINPLGALTKKTNGELAAHPNLKKIMAAVAAEAALVARACGVSLPYQNAGFEAWRTAMATAFNRSSMLQDLERGRPTEIDAINGVIAQTGKRLGIKTPLNEFLWQTIRLLAPLPVAPPDCSYAPAQND